MSPDVDPKEGKGSADESLSTEVQLLFIGQLVDFVKRMENSSIYKSLLGGSRRRKSSALPTCRLFFSAVLVALGGPFNFGYQ
ncbi:hypothetical protein GCK32_004748, partial [Trichostrongylus colubriformis]